MPNDPENRPRSQAELIDEICDRFEQGWRAGKPPAIEDLLQAAPEDIRPALYQELQAIERGYIDKSGRKLIPQQAADRNLLFGILALQMNFISSDTLITAMHAWVLDKQKPLGQILLAQGKLSRGQLHALEALIAEHMKVQVDDHENSFQSCIPVHSLAKLFASIEDPDVRTSVSKIDSSSGNDVTGSFQPVRSGKVGRYVRKELHKKGGLGEVFFADDTELNREVALKEIKEQNADNLDYQLRFRIEAEITGGLEHPGIVPVYGLGLYPNGRPFYAMHFIRGETLKDAIDNFHSAEKLGRDPGERAWRCGNCSDDMSMCAMPSHMPTAGEFCTAISNQPISCLGNTAKRWWLTGAWPKQEFESMHPETGMGKLRSSERCGPLREAVRIPRGRGLSWGRSPI